MSWWGKNLSPENSHVFEFISDIFGMMNYDRSRFHCVNVPFSHYSWADLSFLPLFGNYELAMNIRSLNFSENISFQFIFST